MGYPYVLFYLIIVMFFAAFSVTSSRDLPSPTQDLNSNFTSAHQFREVPTGPNNRCKFEDLISRSEDFGGGYMEFVMVTNSCKYCPAYDVVIDCSVSYGAGQKCKVKNGYPLYAYEQWTMHYQGPYGQFPVLSGNYRAC